MAASPECEEVWCPVFDDSDGEKSILLFKIYTEFFTDAIIVKYLGKNTTVKIFFTDIPTLFTSACKSWIIYLHEAIHSIQLQQILVDVLGKVFTWSRKYSSKFLPPDI